MNKENHKRLDVDTVDFNNPKQILSSPRSLKACCLLGVDIEDLYLKPFSKFKELYPEVVTLEYEVQKSRFQHLERIRQSTIDAVKQQRRKLIEEQTKLLNATSKQNGFNIDPTLVPSVNGNHNATGSLLALSSSSLKNLSLETTENQNANASSLLAPTKNEKKVIEKIKQRQKMEIQSRLEKEYLQNIIISEEQTKMEKEKQREEEAREQMLKKQRIAYENNLIRERNLEEFYQTRFEEQENLRIRKENKFKKKEEDIMFQEQEKQRQIELRKKQVIEHFEELKKNNNLLKQSIEEKNKKRQQSARQKEIKWCEIIEDKKKSILDKGKQIQEENEKKYLRSKQIKEQKMEYVVDDYQKRMNKTNEKLVKLKEVKEKLASNHKMKDMMKTSVVMNLIDQNKQNEQKFKERVLEKHDKVEVFKDFIKNEKDRAVKIYHNNFLNKKNQVSEHQKLNQSVDLKRVNYILEKNHCKEDYLSKLRYEVARITRDKSEEAYLNRVTKSIQQKRQQKKDEFLRGQNLLNIKIKIKKSEIYKDKKFQVIDERKKIESSVIKQKENIIKDLDILSSTKSPTGQSVVNMDLAKEMFPDDDGFLSKLEALKEEALAKFRKGYRPGGSMLYGYSKHKVSTILGERNLMTPSNHMRSNSTHTTDRYNLMTPAHVDYNYTHDNSCGDDGSQKHIEKEKEYRYRKPQHSNGGVSEYNEKTENKEQQDKLYNKSEENKQFFY